MRLRSLLIIILFAISLFAVSRSFTTQIVQATNCPATDYDCQITEIQREIDALAPAHEKNKEELAGLKKQLDDLNKRLASISSQLKKLQGEIAGREEDLAFAQAIFEEKTNNHYKFLRLYDPLLPFLSSDAATAFREINFRQKAADEDRKTMVKYAEDLIKLKNDKATLEKSQTSLAAAQKKVNEQYKFLEGEVAKVETYISSLSAKQSELKALKEGGFQTSVGDVPPSLEPCSGPPGSSNFCSPGFSPAFGAFSFGAPHRKGMSQYGAFGRARAGQNYEAILRAYYGDVRVVDVNTSLTIRTSAGAMDFEARYIPGIAEMPASWGDQGGMEALKAQAIAARSYALSYVGWRMGNQNAGGSICVTEACQVWKSSKADSGGKWKEAVDATRGKILVSNSANEVVNSWYASTAGGYTLSYSSLGHSTPGQWDADGGKDGWPGNAWDKKGGSPWFYKGWYKSRGGASCGRSNPWLTSEEMADILNARYVLDGKGGDKSRISPVDTGCWGGNPYSLSDLRGIGGFTSVSSVSVTYGNDGSTLNVTFQTNKGSESVSGSAFKEAFNLRAPGYIGLKSSLFNIEKL
ncbi:hypothetical protein A2V61_01810 [Candidatus Woesebacteria bacterium RBG_19FT_COMBO_47_8]|uniref:Sporulation stage II protein D amidase enhancer LytB N-terminal domain-containing protein n=1 Tax=Candidatus Woesebacteria bacterium RBG_13_46_13 TaxID=1802479 RepID=A0A1F7X781_9BACT|nr:MAG: hypothetical protein A2Y68_01815 [Candidatus Woesebacteria bacterium RBG_13_46_13]OGM17117.1 MAG: hypothetical protein A2V61_01810 [Candidatus Woesebacteria bacterium RBG_19FT_COMBO_47_8]HJX59319.1 SpoIID/LytB domain-containing protein [Patescibacteria group bacterium]